MKVTVSQLACACVDTDFRHCLRQDTSTKPPNPWLNGHASGNDGGSLHGAKFHQLASKLVAHLCSSASPDRGGHCSGEKLWHLLFDKFASSRLENLAIKDLQGALNLCEALRQFCDRLAKYRLSDQSWREVLLADEYKLFQVEMESGVCGRKLLVSGRIDALRLAPSGGLLLVDYKLTHGAHLPKDVLQLAIYSRLLARSRHGIRVDGMLEYYEPQLNETPVAHNVMENVFESMVQPLIDELLNDDEGESVILSPSPGSRTQNPESGTNIEHRVQADHLIAAFAQFGLGVEIEEVIEAPQLFRFKVRPHSGVKIVSLANRAEDIQVALSLSRKPRIAPESGYVSVDVPKETPTLLKWEEVMCGIPSDQWPSRVAFPVGVGINGKLVVGDFADSNMAHMLVGGASGSGKSEFLKMMVASLMARNEPDQLHLTLVDPKILTFGAVRESPFLTAPVLTDLDEALNTLDTAATEMDRRYQILADECFENLSQRIDSGLRNLPFWVIIIDEYADLILGDTGAKNKFENLVARIAQKGRAAGIHLVLATQRPDAKVVSPLIKANLPIKVCLRVTSHTNSTIILGETGGESLLGKGDLLFDRGAGIVRAQAPYISQGQLAELAMGREVTLCSSDAN